jgi:hypothetical protein
MIDGGVIFGEQYKGQCTTRMKSVFEWWLQHDGNQIGFIRDWNEVSSGD